MYVRPLAKRKRTRKKLHPQSALVKWRLARDPPLCRILRTYRTYGRETSPFPRAARDTRESSISGAACTLALAAKTGISVSEYRPRGLGCYPPSSLSSSWIARRTRAPVRPMDRTGRQRYIVQQLGDAEEADTERERELSPFYVNHKELRPHRQRRISRYSWLKVRSLARSLRFSR